MRDSGRLQPLVVAGLVLVVILELASFWPLTREFFTGDDIFYIARPISSVGDAVSIFTRLDDVRNYRPLTYFIATPMAALWDLNPWPYHVSAILAHILITLLVFWLARLLIRSNGAALIAAFCFGLHGASSHPAFGIVFLPDLTYAVFYLLAMIAFVKSQTDQRRGWYAVSLGAFVLALLSKEPAVTLPAALTLMLILVPGIVREAGGPIPWRRVLNLTVVFWGVMVLYLGWYVYLGSGHLAPNDPNHPYYFELTASNLVSKARYLKWGFNFDIAYDSMGGHPTIVRLAERILPSGFAASFSESSDFWLYLAGPVWLLWLIAKRDWLSFREFLVKGLVTPAVILAAIIFVVSLLKQKGRKDHTAWFGLSLFVLLLLPVLPLPAAKTMLHNLYIPAVGVGIAIGAMVRDAWSERRVFSRLTVGLFLPVSFVAAGMYMAAHNLEDGWPVTGSRKTRHYLEDVANLYPTLPRGAVLYFSPTGDNDWPYFTGNGDVYRLHFKDPTLVTLFGDAGQTPEASLQTPVFWFSEVDGRLVADKAQ